MILKDYHGRDIILKDIIYFEVKNWIKLDCHGNPEADIYIIHYSTLQSFNSGVLKEDYQTREGAENRVEQLRQMIFFDN